MEALLRLLTAGSQDFDERCKVITVVTSKAASAAADMLSSGDYALAYPGSSVLYHGVRLSQMERPLTAEYTSLLVEYLRETNDTYAMDLAEKIVNRFMFRFVSSKSRFDNVRKNYSAQMSDLNCFLALIWEELSVPARRVLENAKARHQRYTELLDYLMKKTSRAKGQMRKAQSEAFRIKSMVDFEVHANRKKKDWSFVGGGLNSLTDDFFLFNEYIANYQSGSFKSLCLRYGDFLLSDTERQEITNATEAERDIKKAEKVQPLLLPIWSFFVGLCHALQQGENELTATDAYWLGLIDEVIGEEGLPSLRLVTEYKPDKPTKHEEDKKEEATSEGAAEAAKA